MKRLAVIWCSMTGGTRAMAHAAFEGACEEAGVETVLCEARAVGPDDLLAADGFLFATPENLAAMAGIMKDFFDRSFYSVLGRIEGRAYAQMVCAGSDGSNAVRQIDRVAAGWRLRRIADPLIVCTHAQAPEAILAPKTITEADLRRCRELGAALAAGLAFGIY